MNILAIISTALSIIASVIKYLESQKQISEVTAKVMADHLKGLQDAIADARKTRAEVVARTVKPDGSLDPERLRNDSAGLWRD